MSFEEKLHLITKNTHEVIGIDHLHSIIQERAPIVYWGTAPTGKIHIGYFLQMLKIADYVNAGCYVKILIADLHSFLDGSKTPLKTMEARSDYYEITIKAILTSLNVDINKIEFIRGTSFQLKPDYTLDMYKLNSVINVNDAKHAGAQVVKQSDSPKMTSLLYPTLQALDEIYLNVDISTGGLDQRKIMMFSRKYLPAIGYPTKRTHIMTPIMGGIRTIAKKEGATDIETKMSASDESSKIDILDTIKQVRTKINKAYCLEGDIIDNSLLEILEKLIFKLLNHKKQNFIVNRKDEYGGNKEYTDFNQVQADFENKLLHPADLKKTICEILNSALEPVRNQLSTDEFKLLVKKAYA
jgi:tyrosyl-tRNA synthetase